MEHAFDSVRAVICQGEPGASIPAARERIEAAWGARVFDHAGSTEVGVFSYPCAAGGGLHVNGRDFLCEILDPRSGDESALGDQGELVLSALSRAGFPAIRFRSGDIVDVAGSCPGGHADVWLPNGIVGRTDDMVVVRGVNVFPSVIEQAIREAGGPRSTGSVSIQMRPSVTRSACSSRRRIPRSCMRSKLTFPTGRRFGCAWSP